MARRIFLASSSGRYFSPSSTIQRTITAAIACSFALSISSRSPKVRRSVSTLNLIFTVILSLRQGCKRVHHDNTGKKGSRGIVAGAERAFYNIVAVFFVQFIELLPLAHEINFEGFVGIRSRIRKSRAVTEQANLSRRPCAPLGFFGGRSPVMLERDGQHNFGSNL